MLGFTENGEVEAQTVKPHWMRSPVTMPEGMQEAADVFRAELVQGECVRDVPWVVPLLLGR